MCKGSCSRPMLQLGEEGRGDMSRAHPPNLIYPKVMSRKNTARESWCRDPGHRAFLSHSLNTAVQTHTKVFQGNGHKAAHSFTEASSSPHCSTPY